MNSFFRLTASAAVLSLVAGCATQHHRAPVEDRGRPSASAGTNANAVPAPKPPPGIENAGKPGYYTVVKGDTLIRIALESGQNHKDIAAWNNIDNPNLIEVGQVLRVVPPAVDAGTVLPAAKPITAPKVEAKGLDTKSGTPASAASGATKAVAASGASGAVQTPASGAASSASSAASTESVREASDEPAWIWPSNGPVVGAFEEGKRKGVAIGGKDGDPVVAAADGRVVYAGSGLRGYGNLVIIKHSGDYLTAYAHNKTLLVKEDQVVRKGQKIAEMGSTDTDKVQLHFEIRKQGKPIDPSKQLPAR
ncbi:MAG: peptidoglycan DD-metalloendopeptidase family protein [Acidobacteriota bacterium]